MCLEKIYHMEQDQNICPTTKNGNHNMSNFFLTSDIFLKFPILQKMFFKAS